MKVCLIIGGIFLLCFVVMLCILAFIDVAFRKGWTWLVKEIK